MKPAQFLLLALIQLCTVAGASAQDLVVASKTFPESRILGELMTQLLRDAGGFEVEHRAGLGGTSICAGAMRSGAVDLYAEYTGTGWAVVLGRTDACPAGMQSWFAVRREYRSSLNQEWLAPFGFDDTYALTMREEQARELGIRTISDLSLHAGALRGAFSHEFLERGDGLPALRERYGLELAEARGVEHALAFTALAVGEVDVIDAYSTDGKLMRTGLRVLLDDRAAFPPYRAAPVVRREALAAHPELEELLGRLALRIDEDRMRGMNSAVEVDGRGIAEVARDFLIDEGLIGSDAELRDDATAGRRGPFWPWFLGRWRTTLRLTSEHLLLSITAILSAFFVALPLALAIHGKPRASRVTLGAVGVLQTIPGIALLALLIAVPGFGLRWHSALFALFLYALLPILRGAHTGLASTDPLLVEVARGMGLSQRQLLLRIRLPLAARQILSGLRTAAVIAIGVATLAAFIGAGGLGEPIVTGLALDDSRLVLSGALPAALLALLVDGALGLAGRRLEATGRFG